MEPAAVVEPFTKADVDYLVDAAKFIRFIPALPKPRGGVMPDKLRIQAKVFRKAEPNNPITGLVIVATVRTSPPGVPKPIPSSALEWFGKRIRGLNYEVWHDNPDGSVVRGWHEHVWYPQYRDSYVVAARPEPTRKDLLAVLKWGLVKWNIEVQEEQLEGPGWTN